MPSQPPQRSIPPIPPRWQPNPDPATINIPGLDTSASVYDQIEQIEQLITIKLQNVDENFAKIHNLLANRILPAVKRYAVGTGPVREAAKFWTSFYEQAAQIRIPTYEDYASVNEQFFNDEAESENTGAHKEHDTTDAGEPSTSTQHRYEPSITSTDSSFIPAHAAISSTPATAHRPHHSQDDSHSSDEPSWAASIESPLVRLDREVQKLTKSNYIPSKASSSRYDIPTNHDQLDKTIMGHMKEGSIKGKEPSQPLLHSVLRQNLDSHSDTSISGGGSPFKSRLKIKTTVPKTLNPYLPPDSKPSDWNGLVDLSKPSPTTPQQLRYGQTTSRALSTPDDDSFDGLPPGMSPPVLMSPARPPRPINEIGLGRTPTREAAARITRDLVGVIQSPSYKPKASGSVHSLKYQSSGVESSMSTVPTPPSLSRYALRDSSDSMGIDSSLESMMRRVNMNMVPSGSDTGYSTGSIRGLRFGPGSAVQSSDLPAPPAPVEPVTPVYDEPHPDYDSEDSMDEIHDTAHPSAAFLMASQRPRGSDDDSFGSSNQSGDSFTADDINEGLAPVHPFAGSVEDDGFDDTFDDDVYGGNGAEVVSEETVFGVPPMQRQMGLGSQQLKMLGEDLLQDTTKFEAQLGRPRRVEDSPTPASAGTGPS